MLSIGFALAGGVGQMLGKLISCRPCLIVLAIVAAFLFGFVKGHYQAAQTCRAHDIAMQLAAAKRDATIAADTVKFQQDQLATANAEANILQGKLDDYENAPKLRCPLGADRARRLRAILGQP